MLVVDVNATSVVSLRLPHGQLGRGGSAQSSGVVGVCATQTVTPHIVTAQTVKPHTETAQTVTAQTVTPHTLTAQAVTPQA